MRAIAIVCISFIAGCSSLSLTQNDPDSTLNEASKAELRAQRIAAAHGGIIQVESPSEGGTVVEVRLPRALTQ